VSGGDGMNSSTQVPAVRSVCVPATLSYHARHLMSLPCMDPTPIAFPGMESIRVWLPRAWVRSKQGPEEDL
jgi:hypothetical protein